MAGFTVIFDTDVPEGSAVEDAWKFLFLIRKQSLTQFVHILTVLILSKWL